ncbi:MAG: energy transducer TonB [Myxococcota bacterium]|nr:energy transducer TonB [Myxococcota bacterium]
MASTTKVHGLTIVASVAFHAALAGVLSWIALGSFADVGEATPEERVPALGETGSAPISIELPPMGEGVLVEEEPVDPTGEPPRVAGGDVVAHLDRSSPGHGGDTRVSAAAINVADRDDRMRLSPDPLSRLDRDQLQRLRVARVRQSWEDRRSTTHPMELTLIVSGSGTVIERRAPAPFAPSRGLLKSPLASVRGGEIGNPEPSAAQEADQRPGGARMGSIDGAPGTGLLRALPGVDHRATAPIGSARPDVAQAAVAIPASDPARPKDDIDTEQEVATTVSALVHASTAGGLVGLGQGGNGAGGEPGAGAPSGAGSHARPLGIGESDLFDYWTSDPHLLPYFRQIHAKIDPLWADAFPKSALLDLKQGTVILEFTVSADGHAVVSWPPVRPSGIDAFDRNCAAAIRRASPLPPIPRALGVRSVRIRAPFVANNPVVK